MHTIARQLLEQIAKNEDTKIAELTGPIIGLPTSCGDKFTLLENLCARDVIAAFWVKSVSTKWLHNITTLW